MYAKSVFRPSISVLFTIFNEHIIVTSFEKFLTFILSINNKIEDANTEVVYYIIPNHVVILRQHRSSVNPELK